MTPEAQRIAIAEACGWTAISEKSLMLNRDHPQGIPPGMHFSYRTKLPDYLTDLNAMHDAESSLFDRNDRSACKFEEELTKVMGRSWHWHATAAQRAEAFLRTLSLWKP
jgi:hypothetical protein